MVQIMFSFSLLLLKNDRAERYNKSEICDSKSKIALRNWLNQIKMGCKLRATLCVNIITLRPGYLFWG